MLENQSDLNQWPLNQWYVAAWSNEVGNQPLARQLCGRHVVLYRQTNGAPVALIDQCIHRQAPLSLGEVEGDNLRCMYHGLLYEPSGRCIHVPGQSAVPPGAEVQRFPAIDRWGWLWFWPGDPDAADDSLIPELIWGDHPDWETIGERMPMEGNYRLLVENLLDLSHLGYLHRRTIGTVAVSEDADIRLEETVRGVRMVRLTEASPPPPIWRKSRGFTGNIDRWQVVEFVPPVTLFIKSLGAPVGECDSWQDAERFPTIITLHSITPEADGSLHYFWNHCRNFERDNEEHGRTGFEQSHVTFLEDKVIIEGQQRNHALQANPFPVIDTNNDRAVLAGRKIMDGLIAAEGAQNG